MLPPILRDHIFPRSLTPLLIRALVACGLGTVFALLGSLHWILALFENVPLQIALVLLVILITCLKTKRRRLALVSGIILLPNLYQLSYYYIPHSYPDTESSLRVVTFNILRDNTKHEQALEFLQSTDADVIAIIEVSDEWIRALAPLEKSHPYIAHHPASHNFGMALYSKYPVINFRRPMPTPGLPLIIADLDYHGSLLTVMVAHPVPPMSSSAKVARNNYMADTADKVNKHRGPVILMGDFNSTPWSPVFSDLISSTGLQDSGKGRGFQSSWNRFNPLFTIPIDHVLHSKELDPVARSIGPACGSDHSPVVVDFAFSPTIPTPKPRPSAPRVMPAPHPSTVNPRRTHEPNSPRAPRVRRVPTKPPEKPEEN